MYNNKVTLENRGNGGSLKRSLSSRLIMLIIFILPMSVTAMNKLFLVLSFLLASFSLAINILSRQPVFIDKFYLNTVLLYLSSFLIGISSIAIVIATGETVSFDNSVILRIINVLMLSTILLACCIVISDDNDIKKYINSGYNGLFIFVVFGVWQVLSLKTNIPFPIETRDWMHGVPSGLRAAMPKRVTSIAEEPSFFAPIIIEFILLHLFLKKNQVFYKLILFIAAALLILTLSAGAYLNSFTLLLFAFIIYFLSNFRKAVAVTIILISFLTILLYLFWDDLLLIDYITRKLSTEAEGGSSRSQFMQSMLQMISTSSFWQLSFGHGLTSMSLLPDFGMDPKDALFRISNNLLIDVFWESGALGLLFLLLFFKKLIMESIIVCSINKTGFTLSIFLVVQLLVTSMYRSEYVSSHFVWVIIMIFLSLKIENPNTRKFC